MFKEIKKDHIKATQEYFISKDSILAIGKIFEGWRRK